MTKQKGILLLMLLIVALLLPLYGVVATPTAPASSPLPTWLVTAPGTRISTTSTGGSAGPVIEYSDSGNKLMIAYEDIDGPNQNILYKTSSNNGADWSNSPINISNTITDSFQVTLDFIGETAYAAWVEQSGNNKKLAFAAESNWNTSSPHIVSADNALGSALRNLKLVANGTNLHLVWSETDNFSDIRIFYAASDNAGQTWSAPQQILNSGPEALEADIAIDSSGVIHVVWEELTSVSTTGVFYAQGSGNPVSWSGDIKISDGVSNAKQPSITVEGDKVMVAFARFLTYDQQDLYLTACSVNCTQASRWSNPTNLLDQFVGANNPIAGAINSVLVYDPDLNTTFLYYHGTEIDANTEYIWGMNGCDSWTTVDKTTGTAPPQTRAIEPDIALGNDYIQLTFLKIEANDLNQIYHMRGSLDLWDPLSSNDSFKLCPYRVQLPTILE